MGSLTDFLGQAESLKVLNITNCGMDAIATTDLAKSMNTEMRLTEFIGFRNKLRDGGIEALADVFAHQGSLEVLRVNSCDIK